MRVPLEAAGQRVDRVLAELLPHLSRSQIQRLIDHGAVQLEGTPVDRASLPVTGGETATVEVPRQRPRRAEPRPEPIPLEILYEDDEVVAVNKPAGMVVHPGAGNPDGTLVNALLHRYGDGLSTAGGPQRPGLVHRLDKGTSGVLVVARTDRAHRSLAAQFKARTVGKEYEAVVYGRPDGTEGTIDLPLGRDRAQRTKVSPRTDRPREATTRWRRVEDFPGFSLLQIWPRTGRTHQVRAHLAAIHHPCVGDTRYAGKQWRGIPVGWVRDAVRRFPRPALHAHRLVVEHPASGRKLELVAPRPHDLEELIGLLRRWRDQGPAGG